MAQPATLAHWLQDRASFLDFLEQQAERWEFFAFVVKAMVGSTAAHDTIAKTTTRLLDDTVAGGPCRGYQDGMRLEPEHNQDVTFPEVMVVCGPVPDSATAVSRPTVIVEILSRSTEWAARGPKWEGYRDIPALRHYVLVSQAKPTVEVFSRSDPDSDWIFRSVAGLDAVLDLDAISAHIPLAHIFRGTDLAGP